MNTLGDGEGGGPPMKRVDICAEGIALDFARAKELADPVAGDYHGETLCMAWYDRAADRESPAHASECHGTCEVPGYEEYASNRGADLKVVVEDGAFVFLYRPLGEFADR